MTWIKLDDTFPDDPKIVGLPDSAFRMYVWGLCYCAKHLTDGFIPKSALGLYVDSKRSRIGLRLVSERLWEEVDGGFQVHNYLAWQRSREQVESERDHSKQRKAAQRARQASRRDKAEVTPKSRRDTESGHAVSHAVREEKRQTPPSSPPATGPATHPAKGEDDPTEQILAATFARLAQFDYDQAVTDGHKIHNPTAWRKTAAANRDQTHRGDALAELAGRTSGRYYPIEVELAEALDPRCGPDDGGRARAEARRDATLSYLHPDQGAA